VSPNVWELLGRQLDTSKRPLFPAINGNNVISQNSIGTAGADLSYSSLNPLGLTLIVDNNYASNTMIVAYAPGFEVYEQQKGIVSVEVPSQLERTFSYYGYFATFVAKAAFLQKLALA